MATNQLTKGMYGRESGPDPASQPFGLHRGQMRGNDLVHNGGWYNRRGEKLGWGDLSAEDIVRISREIAEDKIFIILSEKNSSSDLFTCSGATCSLAQTKRNMEVPGPEYVAEKCFIIIGHGEIWWVMDDEYLRQPNEETMEYRDLTFKLLKRTEAKKMILAS